MRTTEVCRDLRHMWEPVDGGRRGNGWFRTLGCPRCGTMVEQDLDRFGNIIKRRYRYSKGYLVKGGALTQDESGALRLYFIRNDKDKT